MNPQDALTQAVLQGFDPALQEAIVRANDPEWAYRFAHDIQEADLEQLEPIVLRAGHPRVVYDFALVKSHRGGTVTALEDYVIASGDAGLMILFAADIEGADIDRIAEILRGHDNPKYYQLLEAEMKQRGIEI